MHYFLWKSYLKKLNSDNSLGSFKVSFWPFKQMGNFVIV